MMTMKSFAVALALVLPTTAYAGPPEGEVAPIEITPAPLPVAPSPEPAPMIVPAITPPPPVLLHTDPIPPADERALYKKKAAPGIVMAAIGFSAFGVTYIFGAVAIGFDDGGSDFVLPAVGPFISAGQADTPSARAVRIVPGILQIAGLAVGITGVALIAKAKRKYPKGRVSLGGGGLTLRF